MAFIVGWGFNPHTQSEPDRYNDKRQSQGTRLFVLKGLDMGRYKISVGGWFRMWSRQWLKDEKIRDLKRDKKTDLIADLIDLFCLANECMEGGRFEACGVPMTPDMVCQSLSITTENMSELMRLGFVENAPFGIKNWEKYQNPDSKRDFIPDLKRDLKRSENSSLRRKTEDGRRKTKDVKTKDNQDHKSFITFWVKEWESRNQSKYPFEVKDAKAVSRILKTQNIEDLKRYTIAGFSHKEKWIKDQCATLCGFAGVLPRIIASSKTEDEFSQYRGIQGGLDR